MVLAINQTTLFFEKGCQMGLTSCARTKLIEEGISAVDDLTDFGKDSLKQVSENRRYLGGCIPDPDPRIATEVIILTTPFIFGGKNSATHYCCIGDCTLL